MLYHGLKKLVLTFSGLFKNILCFKTLQSYHSWNVLSKTYHASFFRPGKEISAGMAEIQGRSRFTHAVFLPKQKYIIFQIRVGNPPNFFRRIPIGFLQKSAPLKKRINTWIADSCFLLGLRVCGLWIFGFSGWIADCNIYFKIF